MRRIILESRQNGSSHSVRLPSLTVAALLASSCTQPVPGSFRLAQQLQNFNAAQKANTKLDLLFVVDNSASMDVSQANLRSGFVTFASKYMQPSWDIHAATITTDTYLANPAFQNYLNTVALSSGYQSTYIHHQNSSPPGGTEAAVGGLTGNFQDPSYPSWVAGTINSSGVLTRNMTYSQLFPSWGSSWAQLLPGNHDGPMTALCLEWNSYFFFGEAQCFIRDNNGNRGSSHCISPAGGEQSATQCVNTFENDTIHSLTPVISTMPPSGTPADSAWTTALYNNFIMNVSTGSSGSGSERGMSSVLQLMKDNEDPATRKAGSNPLFRAGSLRVIVFVSDEDDQTLSLDASDPVDPMPLTPSGPFSGYISAGAGCPITPNSPQTSNCCATKTVDGYTYTIPICPIGYPAAANSSPSAVLMPVSHIKDKFDAFFQKLDGSGVNGNPNYFVAAIVLTSGSTLQTLREQSRCPENIKIYGSCDPYRDATSDRGDRYIELVSKVGNGSMSMDLASADYTPILTQIGNEILRREASYTLSIAPSGVANTSVTITHSSGSSYQLSPSQYTISGNILTITDISVIASLSSTDQISIDYQPATIY